MALVTLEELARALGVGPRGAGVAVFGRSRPCLEPLPDRLMYRLHRHRAGARKVRRILRRARQARYAAYAADVERRFRAAIADFPDDMQAWPVPRMLCGRAAMRDASLASPVPGEFYPVLVIPPGPPTPAPPLTLARLYSAFRSIHFPPEHA